MTARLTDRDILVRTLSLLEHARCCEFFACPGTDRQPVPMASCSMSWAVWDMREHLRRNGGWCPEHEQALDQCHPPEQRPAALGYNPVHAGAGLCYCAPVNRTRTPQPTPDQET